MGAYQIFSIEFKSIKARDWFENNVNKLVEGMQKPRRLFQYNYTKDKEIEDKIFQTCEATYYMGWDGYGLGHEVIKILKKYKQLKYIEKFLSIDLSYHSQWYDEINQKTFKED